MDHATNLTVNVNNEAFSIIAGAFGVYNFNLLKNRYANTLNATTFSWIGKEYFDVKRIPFGVLPISLLDFTGKLKGNNVLLEWSTSSESNSKEFLIERSDDGSNYRRLNSIPAAGNSSTTKTYSYLDVEATALNYYRLKMTDLDGSFKMSNVVIIKNTGATQDILYVTNPFADQINIRFKNVPKEKISVRLMDMAGKIMGTGVINSPLSSVIVFDDYSKSLSTGLYILQVSYEGKMYSYKLLKQ
ncbi:MAG: T9SS type A sorting domain-containing protein [Chitinophagaceae bacterium]|nr:T9SS type A sorting domain-containing protein [Chitinophagaceae bacterium]